MSFHGEYDLVSENLKNKTGYYKANNKWYKKIRGLYPQCVGGRTGLKMRGQLPQWGPNHAADCIPTRTQRYENGTIVTNEHGE